MCDAKTLYVLARIAAALEHTDAETILADADTFAKGSTKAKPSAKAPTAEEEAIIDHLYSIYPSKTWRGDREASTGKCSKDKVRLRSLLKKRSAAEIESIIKTYVEECNGSFLKNFSTFLNNLPESDELFKTNPELQEQHYQDL